MPKVLIIAGVSILALGLVLGLALPGLATSEEAPPWADECEAKIVKGEVIDVDEEYFFIQSGEEELTISVDENTKYFKLAVPGRVVSLARHWMQFRHQNQEEIGAPGGCGMGWGLQNQGRTRALTCHQMRLQNQIPQPENVPLPEPRWAKVKWLCPFGEESEFSDIEEGDRVVVWAEENSELLAKWVLIIKPTTYASVSGTITDVSSGNKTISITPEDGEPVTPVILSYNDSTIFILKGIIQVETGQYAHAIYDSDNMIAKRVVVEPAE